MEKSSGRRKLSNLVIDRGALIRLSIPFFTIVLVSLGIVLTMRFEIIKALQQTELMGAENLAAMNALLDVQRSVTRIGVLGLSALALICLGFWIVISHRVFGPTIPIRRHIKNLSEGDYQSRIQVRTHDEFKDLANELNHLAEVLADKTKGESRSL